MQEKNQRPGGKGTITSVVFDIGGVLIDWNPRHLYRKIFNDDAEVEHFLAEVCTSGWNREQDRGRPFEKAVSELCFEHPEFEREIKAYFERWEEMLGGSIPDTVSLLRRLRRSRRYPLYALTNWSAETFPIAHAKYDFLSLFDEVVISGQEGLVKPDEEIYMALIERTGLTPPSSVFIDDSTDNVRAAEELGFTGILFEDAGQLEKELTHLNLLK